MVRSVPADLMERLQEPGDTIEFIPTPQGKERAQKFATKMANSQNILSKLPLSVEWVMTIGSTLTCILILRWLVALEPENLNKKIWHADQLTSYTGHRDGPIYLSIAGEVFEVSGGAKHYGPGKAYSMFAGRDATRAYVTGDFVHDLTDDISDFTPEQCKQVTDWRDFYHKEYLYKGRLLGRFYDFRGQPRPAYEQLQAQARRAASREAELAALKSEYPDCSKRWSQRAGGEVWCDDGLYPRLMFEAMEAGQARRRCACFNDVGHSDTRRVYPGCRPDEQRCSTKGLVAETEAEHRLHKTHHEQEL